MEKSKQYVFVLVRAWNSSGNMFEIIMMLHTYSLLIIQLDINTVAAGGGSRLFFRSGMFVVGPESAGAHPGPVCYRKSTHFLSYS